MRYSIPASLTVALCALSSGCASITTGQNQSLSVETHSEGKPVSGASCKLENDKGTWYANSPGTAVVRRSYNDLSVRCEKNGHEPGVTAAKSSTKGMAFGNILFGGIIGAAVDVGSGAAYDYPSIIAVELGRIRTQSPDSPPATTSEISAESHATPLPPSASAKQAASQPSD